MIKTKTIETLLPSYWLVAAVVVMPLLLYTFTLAPDLLWGGGDFATFQTRAYLLEIEPGILGHPLWVVLSHPFTWLPIRNPAWRANFASAIYAALALLFVFLSAWHLTRFRLASILATGALAVSHTFWTYAVMPKVYSLNALLLSASIYLLLRWRETGRGWALYLALVLYGVSQFNHLVMATAAAGFLAYIVLVVWEKRRSAQARRQALVAGAVGLLGCASYIWFLNSTDSSQGTFSAVTTFLSGLGYSLSSPKALARALAWGIALLFYQFPFATLIGFVGLWRLSRTHSKENWLLFLVAGGDVAFLMAAVDPRTGGDYVWNLHYYLQAYVVFALWIAAGFAYLWPRWCASQRLRQVALLLITIVLPIAVYAVAPIVAQATLTNMTGFRQLPGRDNFSFVLSPWKHQETGAREFGEAILGALPPNSVIFADYSLWAVLRYLMVVEGQRPDVKLVELPYAGSHAQLPLILGYSDHRELYLADTWRYYDMDDIQSRFEVKPWPPVYRLILRGD